MIEWDLYEIIPGSNPVTGVMFRGRLRKFGLKNSIDLLAENTEDVSGRVRFAVIHGTDVEPILKFLSGIVADVKVELKLEKVLNPVLSKVKVNYEDRYEI